jgi:hypothetical protein
VKLLEALPQPEVLEAPPQPEVLEAVPQPEVLEAAKVPEVALLSIRTTEIPTLASTATSASAPRL